MARNKKQDDTFNEPFATVLRTLLTERGKTQNDIANITGKTRQTVSQYCNGVSEPGYETLIKIADYFDVSLDYLLGRTEDPSRHPCAADELGFPHEIIDEIREWNDEESDLIGAHHGLVLFLQYTLHTPLYELISGLTNLIHAEVTATDTVELLENLRPAEEWNRNNPLPFGKRHGAWYDGMNRTQEDAAAERLLWAEMNKKYPEFAQRICITFGTRNLEPRFNEICSYFRRYLEDITGYRDYLDNMV